MLFLFLKGDQKESFIEHATKSLTVTVLCSLCPLVLDRFVRNRNVPEVLCKLSLSHEDRRQFSRPGIYVWFKGVLRLAQ